MLILRFTPYSFKARREDCPRKAQDKLGQPLGHIPHRQASISPKHERANVFLRNAQNGKFFSSPSGERERNPSRTSVKPRLFLFGFRYAIFLIKIVPYKALPARCIYPYRRKDNPSNTSPSSVLDFSFSFSNLSFYQYP